MTLKETKKKARLDIFKKPAQSRNRINYTKQKERKEAPMTQDIIETAVLRHGAYGCQRNWVNGVY